MPVRLEGDVDDHGDLERSAPLRLDSLYRPSIAAGPAATVGPAGGRVSA